MKKSLKLALSYLIMGLLLGVYYREATKGMGYVGDTMLGVVHTHSLMLGAAFFFVVAICCKVFAIDGYKHFNKFLILYNIGFIMVITMMLVRGSLQVFNVELSSGIDSMISGFAGISHIVLSSGLVFFAVVVKKSLGEKDKGVA